jgi:beta-ureidopropionase
VRPRGQLLASAARDADGKIVADLNLDVIRDLRNTWRFYRDHRPETLWSDHGAVGEPLFDRT